MLENSIIQDILKAFSSIYGQSLHPEIISVQRTNLQFRSEADYTVMVFPLVKFSKKSPEITANELGEHLKNNSAIVSDFTVVKGFLNIKISNSYWLKYLKEHFHVTDFEKSNLDSEKILIEFSSPNTNKPLHLGHIRNNLLGESLSRILRSEGKNVIKVNLVNDRGIHICKSMLAWQKWGNGQMPENTGIKGDKLVGNFYVLFDKAYKSQISDLMTSGMSEETAKTTAPIIQEAQAMLLKWEQGDAETMALWKMMNGWVYQGFEETYKNLGISFDKIYYESETYKLGKEIVQQGLDQGVFVKKEDGSVWADLTSQGLDEKLLLRSDGTSVYMTQDLGTAKLRYDEYQAQSMIYVVGNEQNYHFDVLKKVLKMSGYDWADGIRHFSYGMVELPDGKMKSREGTVVDADDLMEEVKETARKMSMELGKAAELPSDEAEKLFAVLGNGGLKYFILKVDPVKNMTFNPAESIDFNGNTGPFIQYTHARIKSLLTKSGLKSDQLQFSESLAMEAEERELLILCNEFSATKSQAATQLSPAIVANYAYELAKQYNKFYQKIKVLQEADKDLLHFRLALSLHTASILKSAMNLLGIEVPERM